MDEASQSQLRQLIQHLSTLTEVADTPYGPPHRFTKRITLRLSRVFLHRQAAFNRTVVDALHTISNVSTQNSRTEFERIDRRLLQLDNLVKQVALMNAQINSRLDQLSDEIARDNEERGKVRDAAVQATLDEARLSFLGLIGDLSDTQLQLTKNVDGLLADVATLWTRQPDAEHNPPPSWHNGSYASFEDVFRGPEDEVSELLRPYLDVVAIHRKETLTPETYQVLDIGPGRGEWLRLLDAAEFAATGIELDPSMAERCRSHGLNVVVADCLEYLEAAEAQSVSAVTAFHVVEHLTPPQLQRFLSGASRVLVDGGLLILETPNPENLIVGASNFYLDQTHIRPLPPLLLQYLVASTGFDRADIRRLHPAHVVEPDIGKGLPLPADVRRLLNDCAYALYGPMDYAVVAYAAH